MILKKTLSAIVLFNTLCHARTRNLILSNEECQPRFASILFNGVNICDGGLHDNNLLITAASCTTGPKANYDIRINKQVMSYGESMIVESKLFKVQEIARHEYYNENHQGFNIAIMKLLRVPSKGTLNLQHSPLFPEYPTSMIGWSYGPLGKHEMTLAHFTLVSDSECVEHLEPSGLSTFCARRSNSTDLSFKIGSPLFVKYNDKVTLFGLNLDSVAKNHDYQLFYSIISARTWLNDNLKRLSM